jgi:VWFA-related protein
MMCHKSSIIVIILLIIISLSAYAQEEETYQYQRKIFLVELQVAIFDKEGKFIEGLKPEDFVILDEGKQQEISHFDFVVHDRENIDLISQGAPALKRNFLLLFDLSFSSQKALLKSRKAGLAFIDMILPTDQVAVATWSYRQGLKLVVNFTNDKSQLNQAIRTLGLIRASHLIYDNLYYSFGLQEPQGLEAIMAKAMQMDEVKEGKIVGIDMDGTDGADLAINQIESIILKKNAPKNYELYVRDFIGHLQMLGKALNTIKGKKTVIYFSQGFDSRILGIEMNPNSLSVGSPALKLQIDEMLQQFVGADCAIQSIDAGGWREEKKWGEDSLFLMAKNTGGKFYNARNDLANALDDVLQSTSRYYVIGYYPKELGNQGKYRNIKVKVNQPDLKVVARKGYYEDKPYKEYSDLEKKIRLSEVIINDVIHNDIQFDALVSVFPGEKNVAQVPVFLQFPGKQFLINKEKKQVNLEIHGYLMDDKGAFKDFFSAEGLIDIENSRKILESRGLRFYDMLLSTPGKHKVKLIVQDSDTGELGSKIYHIMVPDYESKELTISPPLFVERDLKWLFSRGYDPENPEGKKKGLPVSYPFTFGKREYVPSVVPEFKAGQSVQFCLKVYNLTIHSETKEPKTNMKLEIIDSEGNSYPIQEISLLGRYANWEDKLLELLFQFKIDEQLPGHYQLKVTFADILARKEEESFAPFMVKP